MNMLRILLIAFVGLAAAPALAVSVRFSLETDPFIEWDYAFHDTDGAVNSGVVSDDDGDGIATFVADVEPGEPNGYIHTSASMHLCWVLILEPGQTEGPVPLIRDPDGNPLIVEATGAPTGPFSLGRVLTATNGTVADLDGVVHENPGIHSAAALLASDVSALPRYTGGAVVGGLVSYEVIPEPTALSLLALGSLGLALRCRRRLRARRSGCA